MATYYQAYWVPGLDRDHVDVDDALAVAFDWLRRAEREFGARGVIVMYAASMRRNRPMLESAPWEIVSRRTRRYGGGGGPVLAVWPPDARTLEYAESRAMGKALCVIPGPSFDCGPWIRRTGAVCLAQGFEVDPGTELSADVRRLLDHMILFDGHNGFIGGGGKEDAIRTLRRISGLSDPPTSKAIEEYIAGSGGTRGDGARRAANWYDDIRAGKRHYDYARRPI